MSPYYYQLSISSKSDLESIKEFIATIYDEGFEERKDSIILRDESPLDEIEWGVMEYVKALEEHLKNKVDLDITQSKQDNQDWIEVYKKSITPIEIPPFYIRASWHQAHSRLDNIIIDPALAFGSGHHDSTRGCINSLIDIDPSGKDVLDVGSGSGILSIVAYRLGAKSISLCDSDELAVAESKKNLLQNGVDNFIVKNGSANSFGGGFDIVLANISADILVAIEKGLKERVNRGGYLVASGIVYEKIVRVEDAYREFTIEKRLQLGEWSTIIFKKD